MEIEKRILKLFGERHVVRKSELVRLGNDGNALKATNSLIDKGFVQPISPLGETSFTLTQKGIRFLNDNI